MTQIIYYVSPLGRHTHNSHAPIVIAKSRVVSRSEELMREHRTQNSNEKKGDTECSVSTTPICYRRLWLRVLR